MWFRTLLIILFIVASILNLIKTVHLSETYQRRAWAPAIDAVLNLLCAVGVIKYWNV